MHRRRLGVAIAVGMLLAATVTTTTVAAPNARNVPIPNSVPLWISHATDLGPANGAAAVDGRVYLAPQGGLAAVEQAAVAMSTPGSPTYHQFLTAAQYQARFGVTDATVRAVTAYLRGSGLAVTGVGASNRYLSIAGSVRGAEKAFGTQIDSYLRNGQTLQAPSTPLTVPAALASAVLTVTGLDTTPMIVEPASGPLIQPPAGFRNAPPCSSYYGETPATYEADGSTALPEFGGNTLPYAVCGYTGTQFRSAYENNSSLDGSGITVAITDAYASPTIASDASTYAARNGDQAYAAGQLTQTLPKSFNRIGLCGGSGWYGEETLDVEAVHAMAQGANIHYYAAASCFDSAFLDTFGQIVDDDTAQLVTNSWSDVEANSSPAVIAAYEAIFAQGATEGISFMFSSGDNGDELAATGTKQVDYPASDPYATGVGGTATAIGQSGNMLFQTGWGTEKASLSADGTSWNIAKFLYGSGGGTSVLFAQPSYQSAVTTNEYRQVPDVAMDADPTTGMLVGETQRFPRGIVQYDEYRIGGTSLASPLFAGMTALALQSEGGTGVGYLNDVIYANTGAFTDITGAPPPDAGNVRADYVNGVDASNGVVYSVRTFNQDSSLTTGTGYDQVTGLGVPNTGWLTAIP